MDGGTTIRYRIDPDFPELAAPLADHRRRLTDPSGPS